MIRPLAAPRLTRRARAALSDFVAAREGGEGPAVLRVEAYQGLGGEVEMLLQLVEASSPRLPGEVERVDAPVPVRFTPSTGAQLAEHLIDFVSKGDTPGFQLRPAGASLPDGNRAALAAAAGLPAPADSGCGTGGCGCGSEGHSQREAEPEDASPLAVQVRHELEERVNPLVSAHGGVVRLVRIRPDDQVAEVEMTGGCQGCAAARDTLQDIVARVLARAVPELGGVEDITDHDAGHAPYYARA